MHERAGQLELSVVGTGYVGLVTAACLAGMGHTIRCVDRDTERIARLSGGVIPFREPGLDEAVATGLAAGRLTFSSELSSIQGSEAVLVAVGTLSPEGEWTGAQVEAAVRAVALDTLAPRTVIVRSTLLPGTTARLQSRVTDIDPDVEVAFNPEFTRQGSAVRDFYTPDRIVIGTTGPGFESRAARLLARIYEPLSAPLLITDSASAELIKVGSNAFLGLKVGFANEITRLAAAVDADVSTVVDGIGLDRRIGRDFLSPGPGFGGSCLPSQARALPALASDRAVATPILAAIDSSNRVHANWIVDVLERCLGSLEGAGIAVLGLTFKSGTDDLRESPALAIASRLHRRGARLTVHDPLALSAGVEALARDGVNVRGPVDLAAALDGVDAVVVATEWPLYRKIDWDLARAQMAGDTVLDVRGIVDVDAARSAGMSVTVFGRQEALGRPRIAPSPRDG